MNRIFWFFLIVAIVGAFFCGYGYGSGNAELGGAGLYLAVLYAILIVIYFAGCTIKRGGGS